MTHFLIALIAAVTALSQPQSTRPEWDDVAVLHVGTEKPHATLMVTRLPTSRRRATARARRGSSH